MVAFGVFGGDLKVELAGGETVDVEYDVVAAG